MENMLVRGVTKDTDIARISVVGMKDIPGNAFKMFSRLAQKGINIDVILQSVGRDGTKDISFTCAASNADEAVEILNDIFSMEGAVVSSDTTVAKISIVGAGMQSNPGVAAKMFSALSDARININMISTSEIKISVLIDIKDSERAVQAVHDAFIR